VGRVLWTAALVVVGLGVPAGASAQESAAQDADAGTEPSASASDTVVVVATITQLAGTTLYIDQGEEAGLLSGDTVRLLERATSGSFLHVLTSTRGSSVLAFVEGPVPLTRGDRLRLEILPEGRIAMSESPEPAGVADPSTSAGAAARTRTPQVTGRVFLDMSALQSSTFYDGAPTGQDRTFLTPTGRLVASATNLPGGLQLDVNARGSYRHASGGVVPSTSQIQFYELSAIKRTQGALPLHIQLGRFYNPYESFSGYWDGAMIRAGSENQGIGAAAGYRPDYANQGFSTDLPKVTVFADIARRSATGGVRSDVSVHRVTPATGLASYTFLGWSGRAWRGRFTVSHDIQFDRIPGVAGWTLTRFQAYASTALSRRLSAYARFNRREPYDYWNPDEPLSYRRDGLGGGMSVSWARGSASADIGVRDADEGPRTVTYSGSVQMSRFAGSSVGLSGFGSYWSDETSEGLSLSPSITRPFGKSYGRLGYRLYRSRSAFHDLNSHALIGSVTSPLSPSVRLSLQGQAGWGGNLRSTRLYAGIWKSF